GVLGPAGAIGDEEIEIPIVVVIEEEGPLGVANMGQADFTGSVLEGAVALVAEEEVAAAGAGEVQVLKPVVPRVGEDGGDADAVAHGDAGLPGDVREGAVAVVTVQRVGA